MSRPAGACSCRHMQASHPGTADADRIFEECAGGATRADMMPCAGSQRVGRRTGAQDGGSLCAALICTGEAYQFDWSHEVVVISGVTVTVKVAHVRLCHSRMMFARAYMRESQEMVFARMTGPSPSSRAPARGASTTSSHEPPTGFKAHGEGRRRWRCVHRQGAALQTARFLLMCSHYLVQPVACTPASGWEKVRSRTRSGWCGSGSSRAAAGQEPRRA